MGCFPFFNFCCYFSKCFWHYFCQVVALFFIVLAHKNSISLHILPLKRKKKTQNKCCLSTYIFGRLETKETRLQKLGPQQGPQTRNLSLRVLENPIRQGYESYHWLFSKSLGTPPTNFASSTTLSPEQHHNKNVLYHFQYLLVE